MLPSDLDPTPQGVRGRRSINSNYHDEAIVHNNRQTRYSFRIHENVDISTNKYYTIHLNDLCFAGHGLSHFWPTGTG